MYDVIIIGAGVAGAAAARELSRFRLKLCVLEKEEDVCCGTSKANSAIVHAGYDAVEGTMKARLNVRGNEKMGELAEELSVPFRRNGSLVLCMEEERYGELERLYQRGLANGVKGLRLLNREEVLAMEPNLADEVYAALYAPTAGIVCPFELTIALAENAAENGTEFYFHTEVKQIRKAEEGWILETSSGTFCSRCIVNAAGVYADVFHNMVSKEKIHITPRKGEYCLFDKSAGDYVKRTVFTLPGKAGKGVLITPTIHGNLLIGPTAEDIEDKEGTSTTAEGLEQVLSRASAMAKELPLRQTITSFAGLRAHEDGKEFIIGEVKDADGFFDCAGIESPGLASSPAIGELIAEMLREKLNLTEKPDFKARRKGILRPDTLPLEERNELIRKHPEYGTIVCRCEGITEGEILDAVRRPLGAKSLDGIKRRTRAGMGRCQSGFCSPRVMEILAEELGLSPEEVTKAGGNSFLVSKEE